MKIKILGKNSKKDFKYYNNFLINYFYIKKA